MRCGLLGRTLQHSYSPTIHAALGGGYSYELFEVEPEGLPAFLERGDWDGINVTIPYKQTVIPFCHALSPDAQAIGSVNTIVRMADGSLYGHNTDAVGFLSMLRKSGISAAGKKVLVLGSGGSSLTVCHVLREQGAREIVVVSRDGQNNYVNLHLHADTEIVVNTTPVGMYPHVEAAPVDLALFPRLDGVLDLIYNPSRTHLLMDATDRAVPCVGGLTMLVGQAAAAAEYFAGRQIDANQIDYVLCKLRNQTQNIILVGMPGSGKSTVGSILHACTGRLLIDTDHEIALAAGLSIPEIFEREGEAGFRLRETEVLAKWGKESGLIIATGGGVVTREENYRHLHQNGMIFFLERPVSALARGDRPLSQGDLREMYAQRLPLYQRFADDTVQNAGEPDVAADRILEVFDETLGD
ncbi:MAG: shikimate kinase [Oscillospiraceae bacterium]|nr:shikimate kinase [Oscillospiraceae bacterium]